MTVVKGDRQVFRILPTRHLVMSEKLMELLLRDTAFLRDITLLELASIRLSLDSMKLTYPDTFWAKTGYWLLKAKAWDARQVLLQKAAEKLVVDSLNSRAIESLEKYVGIDKNRFIKAVQSETKKFDVFSAWDLSNRYKLLIGD